jgi:hypothetical protein
VEPGKPEEITRALEETYNSRGSRFQPPDELRWEKIADQWLKLCDTIKRH